MVATAVSGLGSYAAIRCRAKRTASSRVSQDHSAPRARTAIHVVSPALCSSTATEPRSRNMIASMYFPDADAGSFIDRQSVDRCDAVHPIFRMAESMMDSLTGCRRKRRRTAPTSNGCWCAISQLRLGFCLACEGIDPGIPRYGRQTDLVQVTPSAFRLRQRKPARIRAYFDPSEVYSDISRMGGLSTVSYRKLAARSRSFSFPTTT